MRPSKRAFAVLVGGLLVASLATNACREPTQITVELRTDVACSARLTTAVVVGTLPQTNESLASRPAAVQTTDCTQASPGDAFIGSLVVVPSGDKTGEVAIKVVVGVGIPPEECTSPTDKRCITARRVRKYVADTKLVLPITMNDACRGVPCGADETCSRGRCVSVRCEDDGTCNPPPVVDDAGDASTVFDATDGSNSPDGARPDGGTSLPFDVSLGDDFSCVLRKRDGSVFCWGRNDDGQAGQGATSLPVTRPSKVLIPVEATEKIVSLRAGQRHVIALSDRDKVYGWGSNGQGALGDGGSVSRPPTLLWTGASAIGAGERASCYLVGRTLRCVGDLIAGDYSVRSDLQDFCVGTQYVLGLTKTGATMSGSGGDVVGNWRPDARSFPSGIDAGLPGMELFPLKIEARAVYCGPHFSLATMADGGVVGWGANAAYPLTEDRPTGDNLPLEDSPSLGGFSRLSAGVDHACGLSANKTYCWGDNSTGQVDGMDAAARFTKPQELARAVSATEIYAGHSHSCAQLAGGRILCWGANKSSEIVPDGGDVMAPTEVQGLDP